MNEWQDCPLMSEYSQLEPQDSSCCGEAVLNPFCWTQKTHGFCSREGERPRILGLWPLWEEPVLHLGVFLEAECVVLCVKERKLQFRGNLNSMQCLKLSLFSASPLNSCLCPWIYEGGITWAYLRRTEAVQCCGNNSQGKFATENSLCPARSLD